MSIKRKHFKKGGLVRVSLTLEQVDENTPATAIAWEPELRKGWLAIVVQDKGRECFVKWITDRPSDQIVWSVLRGTHHRKGDELGGASIPKRYIQRLR